MTTCCCLYLSRVWSFELISRQYEWYLFIYTVSKYGNKKLPDVNTCALTLKIGGIHGCAWWFFFFFANLLVRVSAYVHTVEEFFFFFFKFNNRKLRPEQNVKITKSRVSKLRLTKSFCKCSAGFDLEEKKKKKKMLKGGCYLMEGSYSIVTKVRANWKRVILWSCRGKKSSPADAQTHSASFHFPPLWTMQQVKSLFTWCVLLFPYPVHSLRHRFKISFPHFSIKIFHSFIRCKVKCANNDPFSTVWDPFSSARLHLSSGFRSKLEIVHINFFFYYYF